MVQRYILFLNWLPKCIKWLPNNYNKLPSYSLQIAASGPEMDADRFGGVEDFAKCADLD